MDSRMQVPIHGCSECDNFQNDIEDTNNGYVIVFCSDDKTRCTEGLESGCSEIVPKGW
jgi:hypothetical protein